jgi:glycosyltransferase involved in cell wall biosynthesis
MSDRDGVVFSSYYGDLGGGELRLLEHLALTRIPRERSSAVLFEPGPLRDRIEALGIEVREIPWSRATPRPRQWLDYTRASLVVGWHLRQRRAGVLFCNTQEDLRLAGRVARALGVPVVWRSHAELFPALLRRPAHARESTVRMVHRLADRILSTTAYDRDLILAAGLPPERVHVVPLGVDLSGYADAAPGARRVRAELGIAPGTPVIGFVGRLVPQKGHLVFFEALRRLADARPDVRAVVVGDAAADGTDEAGFRRTLHERVAALGLGDVVTFTGFRTDVPALMHAFDLFVHASHKEPFGSVIVEAMAAGLPVIASRTSGPAEILDDGVTGLLTPPGDAPALAEAMARLLAHPEAARTLAERGRTHVLARYDLRETIRLLDTHVLETLDHHGSQTLQASAA